MRPLAGVRLRTSHQMPHCEVASTTFVADTRGHPWIQSSARECPTKAREAQARIVTSECAHAMRTSEHYASTPCTRTQRLTINRMVSKCRTSRPESCDTLSVLLHDWLERRVWAEPPTDLRLNDGRCWLLVEVLLLPSPGVSVRWSSGSTHMTTDAKHMENLADLIEDTSSTPSSRH